MEALGSQSNSKQPDPYEATFRANRVRPLSFISYVNVMDLYENCRTFHDGQTNSWQDPRVDLWLDVLGLTRIGAIHYPGDTECLNEYEKDDEALKYWANLASMLLAFFGASSLDRSVDESRGNPSCMPRHLKPRCCWGQSRIIDLKEERAVPQKQRGVVSLLELVVVHE